MVDLIDVLQFLRHRYTLPKATAQPANVCIAAAVTGIGAS